MKCRICGVEYSDRVLKIHETICKGKPAKIETKKESVEVTEVEIENGYSLDELKEMAINDENIKHAPSTIKRWKAERLRTELNL